MLRGRSFAIALLLLGTMGICAAQEAADIMIGDEIVARVREAGSYESVEHRAAAIDEKINEVLAATDDPGTLGVSLEQVDGLWTIMIDDMEIMGVYPAEAEANAMSPEMLGASWVRRFKDALPGATGAPVTEIGETDEAAEPEEGAQPEEETEPVEPLTIADEPVISSPTTGDESAGDTETPTEAAETPTEAAETPTEAAPATEAEVTEAEDVVQILEIPEETVDEPEEIVAGQGARLLMLEAFNKARELPEDDYLVRREAMANELFDNLVQVMTGGRVTGRIEDNGTAPPAVEEGLETPPTMVEEVETTPTEEEPTIDTGPVAVETEPTTTGPATVGEVPSFEMSSEARAKINAQIPEDDPSYANVAQKVAIKAKFRAASEAYREVAGSDPAVAAQAREVLTAARRANTDGDFDSAERYLDTGLGLLGVTEWEQHIDAAMNDLGLTG
ncbi:MAG: hypothetical protein ACQER1_06375 [Armatimonadota bacterium]